MTFQTRSRAAHSVLSVVKFLLVLSLPILAHAPLSLAAEDGAQQKIVAVAGATGRTGREIVALLKDKGYAVRGLTRDPERAAQTVATDIDWYGVDVRDPETLTAALDGADYVVSTVSAPDIEGPSGPEAVDYNGVRNLVDVSQDVGVKHFILLSAISVTHEFHVLNLTYGNVLTWKRKSEEYLRDSGLPYTIVRPGGVSPAEGRREGVSLEQRDPVGGRYILIPDLAAVTVEAVSNDEALYKTFAVFSDKTLAQGEWRPGFAALVRDEGKPRPASLPTLSSLGLDAGEEFRDCDLCPVMTVIPPGSYDMGSADHERGQVKPDEPQHPVVIDRPFAIGKFEVTFDEWDACVADGGCGGYTPDDKGWGRGNRPVILVSLWDMELYLDWLRDKTGIAYRLPSEAEWEYAARAGSQQSYSWGRRAKHDLANFGAAMCCTGKAEGADVWQDQTAPVGSFPANAFGLHDMHGNVYERVQDCWNATYVGAPRGGSAWLTGDCSAKVVRGGSWISSPDYVRVTERLAFHAYYRVEVLGFRVVRPLTN